MSFNKPTTHTTTLLIHGFIREIKLNKTNIIPLSICNLCISFYTGYQLILYLNEQIENELKIIDFNNANPFKYNCSLRNINDNTNVKWYNISAAICNSPNMTAPKSIHSKILKSYNNSKPLMNNYYTLFKICGSTYNGNRYIPLNNCNAILINKNELDKSNICAFNWNLPSYPKDMTSENCAVYSEHNNTLYSFGPEKECYKLCFDEYDTCDNWTWKHVSNLNISRASSNVVCVNYKEKKKICIVGGVGGEDITYLKTMETLDITNDNMNDNLNDNKNKWTKLKYEIKFPVYKSGIFYDNNNQFIFIGGGNLGKLEPNKNDRSPVAYFNIIKRKWYYISKTVLNHHNKPMLFKGDMNRLYIASSVTNAIEWIDLREGKKKSKKWNLLTENLDSVFDTQFLKWDEVRCFIDCELNV